MANRPDTDPDKNLFMNINRRWLIRAIRYVTLIVISYLIIQYITSHLPEFIRSLKKHQQ